MTGSPMASPLVSPAHPPSLTSPAGRPTGCSQPIGPARPRCVALATPTKPISLITLAAMVALSFTVRANAAGTTNSANRAATKARTKSKPNAGQAVGTIQLSPLPLTKSSPSSVTIGVRATSEDRVIAALYGAVLANRGITITTRSVSPDAAEADRSLSEGAIDLLVMHLDEAMTMTRSAPIVAVNTATLAGNDRRKAGRRNRPLANATELALPPATADSGRAAADLNIRLLPRGQVALLPSAAAHSIVLVVNSATARQDAVAQIGDLRKGSFRRRLGGPYRCSEDDRCALLLRRSYGIGFKEVVEFGVPQARPDVVDTGAAKGPQRVASAEAKANGPQAPLVSPGTRAATDDDRRALDAVVKGDVDYALVRDDAAPVLAGAVMALPDDRRALPAGNFIPVLRLALLGPELRATIDTLSAGLTNDAIDSMRDQVETGGAPDAVARAWLRQNGFLGPRQS